MNVALGRPLSTLALHWNSASRGAGAVEVSVSDGEVETLGPVVAGFARWAPPSQVLCLPPSDDKSLGPAHVPPSAEEGLQPPQPAAVPPREDYVAPLKARMVLAHVLAVSDGPRSAVEKGEAAYVQRGETRTVAARPWSVPEDAGLVSLPDRRRMTLQTLCPVPWPAREHCTPTVAPPPLGAYSVGAAVASRSECRRRLALFGAARRR